MKRKREVVVSHVLCVSFLHLSCLFQHIFGFDFRRHARRNQGLVRVENVANMALGFLTSLLTSLYGLSVHILLALCVFVIECSFPLL